MIGSNFPLESGIEDYFSEAVIILQHMGYVLQPKKIAGEIADKLLT
jgi:hypothetical protein